MEDNGKWSKINNDISEIVEKFQEKIEEEDLARDLRESILEITENTKNIFRSLSEAIESTVKDEEIKSASKDLINNIQDEFDETLKRSKNKIKEYTTSNETLEEE
tara:strand:+ start:695 stop:1009 length:315 start_codon:yes stop_codon:yes gene_type:complete